jgi:hypothetical protein
MLNVGFELFLSAGCQSDVVVGLWVPDNGHGQQDDIGGQQHVEQHTHIQSRTGQ